MSALQLVQGTTPIAASRDGRRAAVDLLVDGMNLTARVADTDVAPMLRDMAKAVADLAAGKARRAQVPCYSFEGPWELGLERAGDQVLVSLVRGGAHPEVAISDRSIGLATLRQAVLSAIDQLVRNGGAGPLVAEIDIARATLIAHEIVPTALPPALTFVEIQPECDRGDPAIRISATLRLRPLRMALRSEPTVERADLFGLLAKGTLVVGIGDRTRTFQDKFVFLFAEQLLSLSSEVLGAWEQRRSYYRRVDLFGVMVGLRLTEPGLWITVGEPRPAPASEARTFKVDDGPAWVEATIGFGRALARALLRQDPSQRQNLRLSAFRRALRALDERLVEATSDDAKVNPSPEIYRAFAVSSGAAAPVAREAAKLRFSPAWRTSFAGIDLRGTFLCGDHLIVGGTRETACVERLTGDFLWRRPTQPAVSVVTPAGLGRIFPDGSIAVHDFATGEIVMTAHVPPRVGGVVTGAVVSSPGLPRMLVVSEGKRHLSAVDLGSGEVRWRHGAHGGSVFRLRRCGKLLIVVAADATLTALDLGSGEVVWRTRDRMRFAMQVGLDHESLFAVAGEHDGRGRGKSRLYHLDPYAGAARWVRDLPEGLGPLGAPLVSDREVVLVTRDRRGIGLLALDRATGETIWTADAGLFPVASAWLSIDDRVVVNSEAGDLLCLSTRSGETEWRHRFPRGMEGDQPRKLEPILRSGALFVPQQQVHVVRPRDGALLGCVTTDLIPDLLRVDERCDVYVAEESGHVAAFRAGAKLSLV